MAGDPAHRLCYTLAETILAPWPASVSSILLDGDSSWDEKIRHVGAFSRFDDRVPQPVTRRKHAVLVLLGNGGSGITHQDLRQAAAATPGWRWTTLGGANRRSSEDPWTALCRADVVITHAGLNSLAAVAAARKPAIVVPQARPHDEQLMTARALARTGLAIVARRWPQAARWPGLLSAAAELGGDHSRPPSLREPERRPRLRLSSPSLSLSQARHPMRCAVITPVAGRHSHLQLQRTGLPPSSLLPDWHIVVTMQDGAVRNLLDARAPRADIVRNYAPGRGAAARPRQKRRRAAGHERRS